MDGSVALYNSNYEYIDVIKPKEDKCINAIVYDQKRNHLYMSLPECNEVYCVERRENADVGEEALSELSSEFSNGFKLVSDDVLGIARDDCVCLYDIEHKKTDEYNFEHNINCILNIATITPNNDVIYGCDEGHIILTNTKNTEHRPIQLFFPSDDNDHNDIHIVSVCVLSNGLLAFGCGNGVIRLCTY